MVDERNIHDRQDFEAAYVDRTWCDYKDLLAFCITYGEPGKIVDIGDGLGHFVECCLKFGVDCVRIEGSEFAIEEAKKRSLDLVHHIMKRNSLFPFEEGEFAVAVSNQTAHHLHQDLGRQMFRESFSVLRPGGIFIALEGSIHNKKERLHPSHINLFTASRLRTKLGEAGSRILAEPNEFIGQNLFSRTLRRIIYRIIEIESFLSTANAIGQRVP